MMKTKRSYDLLGLVVWLAITFGVAFTASQFEPGAWYGGIAKPTWTPPGWIFGPVWGLLYLSMAVAAWLVWRERANKPVGLPLVGYLLQLAVNGLWSWLFFGRQMIVTALVDLLVLVLLVIVTLVLFLRVKRIAGLILIPYLAWISFAAALNFQIWRLN